MVSKKTVLSILTSISILLLTLHGCVPSPPPTEPPRAVTDQAGRTVAIAGPAERIVSGYYISTSACLALGLADKLAGVEAKAVTRPIYALAAPDLLNLPNVGTAKDFSLEACLALTPDLVILPVSLRAPADVLAGMGVPVILVDPESLTGLTEMITLIGDAAGVPDRARRLTGRISEARAAFDKLTANLTQRPAVYMCGVSSWLTTAPRDMYQASMIELAGGVNAARDIGGRGWTAISYEQLLAMDPEVMVIPAEAGYGREDILNDPLLAGVAAVREGRVYQMPGAIEAWDSPAPSCLLGVGWLLHVLHGDIYPLEALRADAESFYREFYGIQIDSNMIE